ncbi:MAG: glycerate kinase [Acidobacteriota bacterium]
MSETLSGDPRADARAIIEAAIEAVEPAAAVRRHLQVRDHQLSAAGLSYDLTKVERILVVGAGKAGAPMARAVEEILGDRIREGHVVVPTAQGAELASITLHEAGHPIPDEAGVEAGREVLVTLRQAGEETLVLCLLSGGGSALLVCPGEGVALEDLSATSEALLACGATIVEINAVRKHLSAVKGGQLARAAAPAKLLTLVLSDVVGDPLDTIASGPAAADSTSFADCMAIVDRYGLADKLPAAVAPRNPEAGRSTVRGRPPRGGSQQRSGCAGGSGGGPSPRLPTLCALDADRGGDS